ncbi:MAG: perosamine synthetase [Actinomycetota bacterium]|nr:perosamine synthetase [Actinomycetota bacterium]
MSAALSRISLSRVVVGREEERLVLEVLRSGMLAQGPMVGRLEAAFAQLTGTAHAVAVSSGTVALVAALQALGVVPGDEVVTSPLTFGATLNAILQVGATARFADVGDDLTMDPAELARALDRPVDRPVRAVLPVHLYGYPADMGAIGPLAAAAGAAVVEDAAQAVGASIHGRRAGSFGTGCFSLYATKNVTTGEGGVVTTDDAGVAARIRLLRGQGMRDRYAYEAVGHNYRMTDLQAAVGVPQLARLDRITDQRQANARFLTEGLAGLPGIVLPPSAPGREHVFHLYTIRVTSASPVERAELMAHLDRRGVESAVIYPRAVYDYPCYRDHPGVSLDPCPRAEALAGEVLSLPVRPGLTHLDLGRIVDAVAEALSPRSFRLQPLDAAGGSSTVSRVSSASRS